MANSNKSRFQTAIETLIFGDVEVLFEHQDNLHTSEGSFFRGFQIIKNSRRQVEIRAWQYDGSLTVHTQYLSPETRGRIALIIEEGITSGGLRSIGFSGRRSDDSSTRLERVVINSDVTHNALHLRYEHGATFDYSFYLTRSELSGLIDVLRTLVVPQKV